MMINGTWIDYAQQVDGTRRMFQDIGLTIQPEKTQKGKAYNAGVLDALYSIRNNFLPPAYIRSIDVARIEQQIHHLIKILQDKDRA